jgi:hypothetical protein
VRGDDSEDRSDTERGDVNSVVSVDRKCAEITSTFGTAAVTSQSGNFVADEVSILVIRRAARNALR